MTLKHMICRYC